MLNQNILQQNYTLFSRPYQLKLPLEIGHVIPDDDCVRLLGQFVEELDLSDLYSTYSRVKENQVSPRQMLKIMLYPRLENTSQTSAAERTCRTTMTATSIHVKMVAACMPAEHITERPAAGTFEKKQYITAMNAAIARTGLNV